MGVKKSTSISNGRVQFLAPSGLPGFGSSARFPVEVVLLSRLRGAEVPQIVPGSPEWKETLGSFLFILLQEVDQCLENMTCSI